MKPELSLVLPFYNEEGNVENVLESISAEFRKSKINYEIIAVNNGSWDKTQEIIRKLSKRNKNIKKVDVKKNLGYGYGILTGLRHAKGSYVGYGWGDGQIPAEAFPAVFKKLKRNGLDICKVKRLTRESFARKVQSKFYNGLMLLMFSINLKDVNGCPKIMKREVYKSLDLQSRDWFLDPELIIKAKRKKYKISEVPVISRKRLEGKSKVDFKTPFEFLKNMVKYRLGIK